MNLQDWFRPNRYDKSLDLREQLKRQRAEKNAHLRELRDLRRRLLGSTARIVVSVKTHD